MTSSPSQNRQSMQTPAIALGEQIRGWRQRRRLSQLELACEADISARHVSFIETGRSVPSREMLLKLSERLAIPLRERNLLLLSAGFAPVYSERRLDDPVLRQMSKAVELVLAGHEPYPALAIDRHWCLVSHNSAVAPLLAGVAPHLLRPPSNVLRVSLHPEGLAPQIENFPEYRAHILSRLRHQIDATGDPVLVDLLAELESYPAPRSYPTPGGPGQHDGQLDNEVLDGDGVDRTNAINEDYAGVIVPLRLRTEHGVMSFFGTTTVFGTPLDVTLAELAIESMFPADARTAQLLANLARAKMGHG
jgi:transcriptional regulator with XRE-family HTH domain